MKRFLLAAALCVAAATTARPQGSSQNVNTSAAGSVERARPAVNVQESPGAPLRVTTGTKWATLDQQMLEISFTVTNAGRKPIRAYTVRVISGVETPQEDAGCFFNSAEKPGKILQKNKSETRSTWRPAQPFDPQPAVELTLDFVEFADGDVWGADTCQSAERLGGMRAGARAARAHLKKNLDEMGFEVLLEKLYSGELDLTPPAGHSDAWKAGFRGAFTSLRERVRQANVEGGLPEVEAALQRPFDTTDNQ